MNESIHDDRNERFLELLRGARTDRGKMACLRRGLSASTVMDAWPLVAAWGGRIGQPGESAHLDIAALFALHPLESNAVSFGETCRSIAMMDSIDGKPLESHERRFRRLLSCDRSEDLSAQLRSWVRLAAARGVGVNYRGLLEDLRWWNNAADRIRVRWARSFWRVGMSTAGSEA